MLPKDALITQLLSQRPGIETLAALIDLHPYELSPSGRIDYLTALEKQNGWLQSLLQSAFVAVADDQRATLEYGESGVADEEREEIAAALRLSPATAQAKLDTARILVNQLPATCAALASGEISAAHATVIARESAPLLRSGVDRGLIAQIEERAIASAEYHTPAQVAYKIRSAVARALPVECEESFVRAHELRKVSCYPERDGMATVIALLSAPDAQAVMAAIEHQLQRKDQLNQLSTTTPKGSNQLATTTEIANPWKVDNRRADAFVEIINQYFTSDTADQSGGDQSGGDQSGGDQSGGDQSGGDQSANEFATNSLRKKEIKNPNRKPISINVTIELSTLLGISENPGQLTGYGAIPASLARELAADGDWQRFITDPTDGKLLDLGRKNYRPPQYLIDFLIARDRTCRFPGCRYPAHRSDIDHVIPWDQGGETTPENLGALCRRHHRLKTHGGWKVTATNDGGCEWISPTGKHYLVPARPVIEAA